MRAGALVIAMVLGCGGSVTTAPDGSGGSGAASSSSSGAADAGAGASAVDAGPGWTVPPGQTHSRVDCDEEQMLLFVEIWPTAESECLPSPAVTDLLVLGISEWDGSPGTFVVGQPTAHGTAHASTGIDETEGSITVEPFVGTPRWLAWELSAGEGRTDLGLCGKFDEFPCVPPP
jgi:hypothetical protein